MDGAAGPSGRAKQEERECRALFWTRDLVTPYFNLPGVGGVCEASEEGLPSHLPLGGARWSEPAGWIFGRRYRP